jgi:hypothetical protein
VVKFLRPALELIAILEDAKSKGLDSKDYDGTRWPARVNALQSGDRAGESARVKFDVALTVSEQDISQTCTSGGSIQRDCIRILTQNANLATPGRSFGRKLLAHKV